MECVEITAPMQPATGNVCMYSTELLIGELCDAFCCLEWKLKTLQEWVASEGTIRYPASIPISSIL